MARRQSYVQEAHALLSPEPLRGTSVRAIREGGVSEFLRKMKDRQLGRL